MLLLLYWQFGSLTVLLSLTENVRTFSDIAIVSAWFLPVFILSIRMQFLFVFYLINFIFNDFIFSTRSGFDQRIITHILGIEFITRSYIFLSEIHIKFVIEFLVLIFLIGWWLVGWWSVHLVGGRWWVGRLVGSFKKALHFKHWKKIYSNSFSYCFWFHVSLKSNFIEIALQHGYSPINWLHIFRTPFL